MSQHLLKSDWIEAGGPGGAGTREEPVLQAIDGGKDHFVVRDGVCFAGTHLILDVWNAERLDDQDHIEATLRRIVEKAKATLLHIHLHRFTPNGGISGVAVLAESHISVHTWPERAYAAFDVFMCGDAVPHVAIEELREAFSAERVEVVEHRRGTVDGNPSA
jgi:S-adenosylmethionine decarboxylase